MRPERLRLPRGTLLVLAAHPDDECLGAGGVLALHARAGGRAAVAFATDGAAGGPRRGPRLAAVRRVEARLACRDLGAAAEFWGLEDGGLARERRLADFVAEALRRHRPALLLRPAADDPHPDHRALARAAGRAPALTYEVTGPVRPDVLADVSAVLALKLGALRRHRTQESRHGWSGFAARRAAALALLLPGARAAEGFRRGGGG
ncbi:PIG-L family deacetylase [bacterium]|nr:MAG: PIG-L family deacetylase [bacterium]